MSDGERELLGAGFVGGLMKRAHRQTGARRPRTTAALLTFSILLVAGAASAQQTVTLKMQATWPASLTLYENFTYFAERVGKISAGTLKIDAMPASICSPILP